MPDFIVVNGTHSIGCSDTDAKKSVFFKLLYVSAGSAQLHIKNSSYHLAQNTIAFIGAFEHYALSDSSEDCDLHILTFSPQRLDHRIGNPQLTSIFKNRPAEFIHCCEAVPPTEALVRNIFYEYTLRDSLSEDMIACYLHELLTIHYRILPDMFPMPERSIKPRVYQIKEYLDRNFSGDVKVAELADSYYVNKYYLCHIFHTLTGYSPKQYLRLVRLTHAKKLLTTTSLPIKQIAVDSGFPDANSFIRTFKSEFGITPNRSRSNG